MIFAGDLLITSFFQATKVKLSLYFFSMLKEKKVY